MTLLVIAVLGSLVVGTLGSWAAPRVRRRQSARRQRRALGRLGSIAGQERPGGSVPRRPTPSPPVPRPSPQAYVRLVGPGDERPALVPRPLAGGWRPVRATGAAPFRAPAPRGDGVGPHGGSPIVDADGGPGSDGWGDDVGSVRVVRAGSDSPPSPRPEAAPEASPGAEPAAGDERSPGDRQGRAAPGDPPAEPLGPAPGVSSRRPALAVTGPPSAGREDPIVFDDLSESDPPRPVEPVEPVVAGGLDPARRSRWAEQLASVRAHQTATGSSRRARASGRSRSAHRSHSRQPAKRGGSTRRGHRLFGASAIIVLAGAAAAGAFAGVPGHHRRGTSTGSAARAPSTPAAGSSAPGGSPAPSSERTGSPAGSSGSSGRTVAVKLVSSSTGVSVYQLSDVAPITVSASGRCWVEVRSADASGPVVHESTLVAGDTLRLTGPVWIRLGNPTAVRITAGSTTLTPPVTTGSPYDLEFRPAS